MATLRWGIISAGNIASKFANTLRNMKDDTVLTAVAARDIDKARAFAEEYGAKAYFGSYQELAECNEVDAVYIGTPNSFHFENTMMCLKAGKHVLCEKPFTINAKQAQQLYETAKAANLMLLDGLWTMHLPVYYKIRELVQSGCIGDVKHIRAEFGFSPSGARKDFKMSQELGGGSLLDVGIYPIVFASMLLGTSPSDIMAYLNISEYGTDDFASMILTYNGQTAALSSAIGTKMPTEGVIFGSKGYISVPNIISATSLTLHPLDGDPVEHVLPLEINGFEYQIRDFVSCVNQGLCDSKLVSKEFSLGCMQIMDAVRERCGFKYSFEE